MWSSYYHEAGVRKLRILAMHGNSANSNVMKFQMSYLRRHLGNDVEWLIPDGPEPWEPDLEKAIHMRPINSVIAMFYEDRPEFEKRIANGKAFVSWYSVDLLGDGVMANPASVRRGCDWVMKYIEENGPIDIIVLYSAASILMHQVAKQYRAAGKPVPWKVNFCFNPSPLALGLDLDAGLFNLPDDQEVSLPQPTFVIVSTTEPSIDVVIAGHARAYSNREVFEHGDGHAFPTSPPRAQEIYERLAREVQRLRSANSNLRPHEDLPGRAAGPAESPRAEKGADSFRSTAVSAGELAEMLLGRRCLPVLVHEHFTNFPEARRDICLVTLRMMPPGARQRLAQLRSDGRRLVAISATGDDCHEYCRLLAGTGYFEPGEVCRLDGGLSAWESWEVENAAAANEIRSAYGLPQLQGSHIATVSPDDLAGMLCSGSCVVADARERAEIRQRAFPGAEKGVSLHTLQMMPHVARRKLEQMSADGRRLVAISETGARCPRYCSLLVGQFGLEPARVCWLAGGVAAWENWERYNPEVASEIRLAHNLPASMGRALADVAAARERSLDALR